MRLFLALLVAALLPALCLAQTHSTIRSDRPGQASGPHVVGTGVLQVQGGLEYRRLEAERSSLNSLGRVIRLGLSENFELNTSSSVAWLAIETEDGVAKPTGFLPTSVGLRYNVFKGAAGGPALGIQTSLLLPKRTGTFQRSNMGAEIVALASQPLSDRFALLVNAGFDWSGDELQQRFFYVLNLGYTLSDKWSIFIESFGDARRDDWQVNLDGGVAFLLSNSVQLDAYGGIYPGEEPLGYFASLGLSWRIWPLGRQQSSH